MKINRLLGLLLAAVIAMPMLAQNGTITPYSRYGYGILGDNATSSQRGMGGVGYAMNSGRQISVMNPASYAAIDSLTFLFDMGVDVTSIWSEENGMHEQNFGGGLDFVTMAFPLTRWMGASIGLLPFSSVGYAFGSEIQHGATTRTGAGNINQAYIGLGVSPLRNLYIGANIAYLFGETTNDEYAYTITGATSLFQSKFDIEDWRMDIGVQYNLNLGASNRVTLGFNFSPAKDLNGRKSMIKYDVDSDTKPDTVGDSKLRGNYSLPATYGAGINYQWRNRLMVEADFTYQPWKDAKFATEAGQTANEFANRWKVALGAQYTPQPRGGYGERIQYRLGAYYNHDYIMVKGNNVREYGITMGLGLPVPGFKSVINVGLEYKHRQANPQPLIKEQYLNLTLGINFDEMWFRKARIY